MEKQGLVGRRCTDFETRRVGDLGLQTGNWAGVQAWMSSVHSSLCVHCFPDANTYGGVADARRSPLPACLSLFRDLLGPSGELGTQQLRATLCETHRGVPEIITMYECPQNKLLLSLVATGNSLPLTQLNTPHQNRRDREETEAYAKWEKAAWVGAGSQRQSKCLLGVRARPCTAIPRNGKVSVYGGFVHPRHIIQGQS